VSGFEPLTCRLQEVRLRAPCALAAPMARDIAPTALTALGLSGDPVHARGPAPHHPATVRNVTLGTASTPASQAVMEPSVLQTSGHNALAWAELEDNRSLGTHWTSRALSGLIAPPDPGGDW
jgi:hypothetical protein